MGEEHHSEVLQSLSSELSSTVREAASVAFDALQKEMDAGRVLASRLPEQVKVVGGPFDARWAQKIQKGVQQCCAALSRTREDWERLAKSYAEDPRPLNAQRFFGIISQFLEQLDKAARRKPLREGIARSVYTPALSEDACWSAETQIMMDSMKNGEMARQRRESRQK